MSHSLPGGRWVPQPAAAGRASVRGLAPGCRALQSARTNRSLVIHPPLSLSVSKATLLLTELVRPRGEGVRAAPDDWRWLWAGGRRPCTGSARESWRGGGGAAREQRVRHKGRHAAFFLLFSSRDGRDLLTRTRVLPLLREPHHTPHTHVKESTMADATTTAAAPPADGAPPPPAAGGTGAAPPAGPIDPEKKARQVRGARCDGSQHLWHPNRERERAPEAGAPRLAPIGSAPPPLSTCSLPYLSTLRTGR